jgi:hypothetical protein
LKNIFPAKFALLFAMIIALVFTSYANHDGVVKLEFCGGDGLTEATAYEICTPEDLAALAAYVNTGNGNATKGVYYKLMNDIDLANFLSDTGAGYNGGYQWKPIGDCHTLDASTCFQGNFDGNNKVVKNLQINRTWEYYIGLFGYTYGSTIKNLNVENCNIFGNQFVGGVVGCNEEQAGISNCYVSGAISGTGTIGGIVGSNKQSKITNCYVIANMHGTIVGGIAGRNISYSEIIQCYTTGEVSGSYALGGLVGINDDYATVTHCHSTGNINGSGSTIGGLVGSNNETATITRCYTTGNINGEKEVGGLVGVNGSTVTNCYATGSVTGSDNIGGLVGDNLWKASILNSYAKGSIKGGLNIGGLIGENNGTITNCVAANDSIIAFENTTTINRIAGFSKEAPIYNNNYAINSMILMADTVLLIKTDDDSANGTGENPVTLKTFNFYHSANNWYQSQSWNIDKETNPEAIWKICDYTTLPYFQYQEGITCALVIIATAEVNGNIYPSGIIILGDKKNKTFLFTANYGYEVEQLLVDDVNIEDSIPNGTYTFHNIDRNHTIHVTFVKQFVPVLQILDVPADATATIPLELSGRVIPTNATNKEIVWSIKDAGTTGASLIENTLFTKKSGTVIVTAIILDGTEIGVDYSEDFIIHVKVSNNTQIKYKIYPNPTTGLLIVENGNINVEFEEFQIFDVTGKMACTIIPSVDNQLNEELLRIDVTPLPNGIYVLNIVTSKGTVSEKFVKIPIE